jgi:hypothetical protein
MVSMFSATGALIAISWAAAGGFRDIRRRPSLAPPPAQIGTVNGIPRSGFQRRVRRLAALAP